MKETALQAIETALQAINQLIQNHQRDSVRCVDAIIYTQKGRTTMDKKSESPKPSEYYMLVRRDDVERRGLLNCIAPVQGTLADCASHASRVFSDPFMQRNHPGYYLVKVTLTPVEMWTEKTPEPTNITKTPIP